MCDKKEFLYPIFLKCIPYTEDSFWQNIFEDLAYGKTPSGIYFSKNTICCNFKKKEFIYKINSKKTPDVIFKEIYELFVSRTGIISQREKALLKLDLDTIATNVKNVRCKWTKIRKKAIKDLLIEEYVARMKRKYNLSLSKSQALFSKIVLSLIFKEIKAQDIIFNKYGSIKSINRFIFSKGDYIYEEDIYNICKKDPSLQSLDVLESKICFGNLWSKYKINN